MQFEGASVDRSSAVHTTTETADRAPVEQYVEAWHHCALDLEVCTMAVFAKSQETTNSTAVEAVTA